MESIKNTITSLVSDWPVLQEKSQYVVDLVKAHPWTSLGVAGGTVLVWSYVRTPRNLPPGPSGYPIIGAKSCFSMMDLPKKMLDWREKYGEVISFYKYGKLNVILNSERTIKDAFVKQADELSHRADLDLFLNTGVDDELFTAPYNEVWKKNKKFAVSTLKGYGFGTAKSESKMHGQLQYLENFILKNDGAAIDMYEQFKLLSAGTMAEIVLGTSGSWDDPDTKEMVKLVNQWYNSFGEAYMTFSVYKEMSLPRWLSRSLTRKGLMKLAEANRELIDFLSVKIKEAKSDIEGRSPESVVDAYLKERDTDPDMMAKTIMLFLPDAIDTASIVISWCLLYTILDSEVQEKLYKEVNSVIGTSRLPTLSDRAEMPFTQAVIAETLRLQLVTPITPKRILKSDIKVDGYTLPRGTLVAGNFYGIHFDPEIFPDPFEFKPSRFINSDGTFNLALAGKTLPFGISTRKCIGEPYVRLYVFFFITRIVQRFKLSFDPSAPAPTAVGDGSFIAKPEGFKACFTSR